MKEIFITGNNLTDAYHKALVSLHDEGILKGCLAYGTTQKECSMTIHVEHPLQEPMISKLCICSPESLEQYRQEMLDGILDFEIGKVWQYTYHNRMVKPYDQIKFVVDELSRDTSSRRAVIIVRDNAEDMYSDDPACLQHIQYFINNGKLDCCAMFRSNDLVRATWMNAFALIKLQERIAEQLNVEIGTYTHRANSMHCYESSFKDLDNYCKAIKTRDMKSLVYNFKDGWDLKMEKAKLVIAKKVEDLKCTKAIEK